MSEPVGKIFWHGATCSGCCGAIPAQAHAYELDGRPYHVDCLISFLYGAWQLNIGWYTEACDRWSAAETAAAHWKGNHAEAIRLKREAEGKGPRQEQR